MVVGRTNDDAVREFVSTPLTLACEGGEDVVECDGRDDDDLVVSVCTNVSSSLSGAWCWPPASVTMCMGCVDGGLLISTVRLAAKGGLGSPLRT